MNVNDTRRLAQGRTSWIEKLGHHVRVLTRLRHSRPFSILIPIIKGPPGGLGCHYKGPNATVQGIRAAAFLFLSGSAVFCLACEGEEGYSIHLRVPGGDGELFTLAMDASWRKFGGTSPNFLSANH